jgi:hypothetical protein
MLQHFLFPAHAFEVEENVEYSDSCKRHIGLVSLFKKILFYDEQQRNNEEAKNCTFVTRRGYAAHTFVS